MELIQLLKSHGVTGLSRADGIRFSRRTRGLCGTHFVWRRKSCRHSGLAWSASGQRSKCGASTPSDAPYTPLSCPCDVTAYLKRQARTVAYSPAPSRVSSLVRLDKALFSTYYRDSSMVQRSRGKGAVWAIHAHRALSRVPIWTPTVARNASSSTSGTAIRKDFNSTTASRKQVLRS
jgi:hypothetical protein